MGFDFALLASPILDELETLISLYQKALSRFRMDVDAAKTLVSSYELQPPAKPVVPELAAWVVVSNILLNLDETLTKE